MTWTGEVPAQKWVSFYQKVLSKFATGKGLKLILEVGVSPEGAFRPGSGDLACCDHEVQTITARLSPPLWVPALTEAAVELPGSAYSKYHLTNRKGLQCTFHFRQQLVLWHWRFQDNGHFLGNQVRYLLKCQN